MQPGQKYRVDSLILAIAPRTTSPYRQTFEHILPGAVVEIVSQPAIDGLVQVQVTQESRVVSAYRLDIEQKATLIEEHADTAA